MLLVLMINGFGIWEFELWVFQFCTKKNVIFMFFEVIIWVNRVHVIVYAQLMFVD